MSRITENHTDATTYAIIQVIETGQEHKLYYRRMDDQYIVASPGSEIPKAVVYEGKFMMRGDKVVWVSSYGTNEST